MNVETRLRAIHLMEQLEENREYAEGLGIEWRLSRSPAGAEIPSGASSLSTQGNGAGKSSR